MTYMETTETKKFSQKLTRWAVGVSVAYAGLLVWLVWVRFDKLPDMELNTIGDFLAGAFSPLAFFWLVVGYFQQGHELGQNTEALRLQVQEMSAAVEQQREQTAIFKRQAVEERERHLAEKLPAFGILCHNELRGTKIDRRTIEILNHGAPCSELSLFISEPGISLSSSHERHVDTGDRPLFFLYIDSKEVSKGTNFVVHGTYQCALGKRHVVWHFALTPAAGGLHLSHSPDLD